MSTPKNNSSKTPKNDQYLDQTLRPQKWDDYIGQESIKNNLKILLKAARDRKEPPEHLLFYGPAGLGKTTLAHLIAKELNTQMKITSGPAIERVGDLASILTNLSPGDILFIDEAHRLNKMIEEILYPAMESGALDIIIGKGPSARTIQLDLPPFTLVAATTRISLLSSPLRSRFSGGTFRLEFYNEKDVQRIVVRSSKILNMSIDEDAAMEIAKRSRFTPRIANHLLKRCRDYAQVNNRKTIDLDMAKQALEAALAEDSDFAEAHYNLAMILEQQGHREEAKPHYFEAANLAPGHTIIWNSPPLRPYKPGRGQLFPLLPKYMPKWSPFGQHPSTSATPGGPHATTEWEAHEH